MGKRYSGVREIAKGIYEINFQIDGVRTQARREASSEKEAYLIRCEEMSSFKKKHTSVADEVKDRPYAEFRKGYRKIREKLKAQNRPHKTILHYKKTYWWLFYEYRKKKFPSVKNFSQLTPIFFEEAENYFVNVLGLKWRAEKTYIDTITKKLFNLGYVSEDIIKKLKEMGKPPQTQKDYPNIDERKLEAMFEFIKKDRPDYYRALYFIKKTGRRIEETTLYRRDDLIWDDKRLTPLWINVRPSTMKVKDKRLPLNELLGLESIIIDACRNGQFKAEPYLFLNRKGRHLQQSKARDYLKAMSKDYLGVEITPHFFRHRFMTLCATNSVSMRDAMAIAGISDTETAMRYYQHTTPQGRQKALEIS